MSVEKRIKNMEDKNDHKFNEIKQRMDYIEENLTNINENIHRLNQAVNLIQLQSGMPDHYPTYEPIIWQDVEGGNCYSYVANDKLYNWKLHGKGAPTPGFTKGKSYNNEDPWRKIAFGLHFDSRGRAQLLYDIDSRDLKVPKVKANGYHILYFATTKESALQGFHFAREDKNLDGSRQGWSHRDAAWIFPEKIKHFPKQERSDLESYRLEILDKKENKVMIYRIVCIFFVLGHGFNLVRGMSVSSSEFNEIPEKIHNEL